MTDKMGLHDDEGFSDDGSLAEDALNNPKTTFNKILSHQALPIGLAVVVFGGAGLYEWVDKKMDGKEVSSAVAEIGPLDQERGREVDLIRDRVEKAGKYDDCVRAFQPTKTCALKMGESFEGRVRQCSTLTSTSDVMNCCREFSERIRQCADFSVGKL